MRPIFFNFQLVPAPLAVLAFLALIGGEIVVIGAAVVLGALDRRRLAKLAIVVAAAAAGVYLDALLALSLVSRDQVASLGEEKYFCEIDCHLAYSVVGVESVGRRRIVTLRVRFDEDTISPCRPRNLSLTPNRRVVRIVDEKGRFRAPVRPAARDGSLARPLRPGESEFVRLVFELPGNANGGRLLITEAAWPTRFLLGHENSFFHRKVFFRL
jgi:hypothetical protein